MKDLLKELDNYINGESDLSLEELQEKCDCYAKEVTTIEYVNKEEC